MNPVLTPPLSPSKVIAGSPPAIFARSPARQSRRSTGASDASVLIFDGITSDPVDLDFRGSVDDVLARLPRRRDAVRSRTMPPPSRGPGRPKLGVVAREITLLPRHWEWLAQQPGGASVAIRKLVEEARRARRGQGSHPRGPGSGLSLHVGDGRQQAAFRRSDPRAVRAEPAAFRRIDRRMAGRCARPCRTACGAGVSPRARRR